MPKRKTITGDNTLVPIRTTEVPEYLRRGALYPSFEDEDEVIMVPGNAVKTDIEVKSAADAIHLFESLRFWLVDDIPASFLKFAFTQKSSSFPMRFWDEFGDQFKWLSSVRKCMNGSIKKNTIRMQHIILSGDEQLLRVAHTILPCLPEDAIELALISNSVPCLRFVHDLTNHPGLFDDEVCSDAIVFGKDETMLAAAHELGYPWDERACTMATARNNLPCLKYLHEHGCPWDVMISKAAVVYNSPLCLQYALEHGCPDDDLCYIAASSGLLACLQCAHEHGCSWDANTCFAAAEHGHLDCLQYAHEHGCAWSEEVCDAAVEKGHIHCLQYAHEHGCPWDTQALCEFAAELGQLGCLQYLHEHGCPWDAATCTVAADQGHLHCLRYLHEQGCPWDEWACQDAALYGHIDCLRYLHEHGCPWDEKTTLAACTGFSVECLRYAHEQGCEIDTDIIRKAQQGCSNHCWNPCYEYIAKHITEAV